MGEQPLLDAPYRWLAAAPLALAIEMPDAKLVQMLVARRDDGNRIFVAGAKLTVGVGLDFFQRDAIVDADVGKVPHVLVVMLRFESVAP